MLFQYIFLLPVIESRSHKLHVFSLQSFIQWSWGQTYFEVTGFPGARGKQWKQWLTLFFWAKITADGDCSHEIKRHLLLGRKVMTNLDSILKNRLLCNKGPSSQGYGFSSSHVWMWELDYKESWAQKNWCFWTVVLAKTLKSSLDCKEIQPVHLKGDQSWVFIGRTDAEAETPILWAPDAKSWLIGKDPDAGRD